MRLFSAVLAVLTAVIVLAGGFLPIPVLVELRYILLQWGAILAGTAVLVGFYNLLAVHLHHLRRGGLQILYSLALILAALIAFSLVVLFGPQTPSIQTWLIMGIVRPVEASLLGILSVTLIYALMRLLRRRLDSLTLLFLLSAFFFLLAMAPTPWGILPLIGDFLAPWLQDTFVTAGARGLLLGMALGALTTGLRLLLAVDRPYGGK
ncbi:MAG: hypothetical protein ACK4VW_01010 [Anaerolineales bacterium]